MLAIFGNLERGAQKVTEKRLRYHIDKDALVGGSRSGVLLVGAAAAVAAEKRGSRASGGIVRYITGSWSER